MWCSFLGLGDIRIGTLEYASGRTIPDNNRLVNLDWAIVAVKDDTFSSPRYIYRRPRLTNYAALAIQLAQALQELERLREKKTVSYKPS